MRDDVLVIGAGPAGISSAYYLDQAGIPYRVVDRASVPASTWANQYPSLELNTAGFVSHLPGKRIPLQYGVFPRGRDYYQYILDYLREHPFHIEYGVEVVRVAPERGGWRVETNCDSDVYPAVILAVGRFGNPYAPHIPGQETFRGRIVHARDFQAPQPFAGRRVLVVGCGPSAVDIALELVPCADKPVLLSVRSDILLARTYPFGLPNTAWQILFGALPAKVRDWLTDRIVYQPYSDQHELGVRFAPNREQRIGTSAPVRGRGLIDAVRAGNVRIVGGLARLEGDCALLDNGAIDPVDDVILCTGYRPVIDFLDFPYELDEDGWHLPIDPTTQQVKDHPGLYLVGWYYRGLGPLHNIRAEARRAVTDIERCLHKPIAG
jgi:glycine/D-amino acid oxidase-like deaminating enzyme